MRSKAILMALLAFAFGGVEAAPITVEQAKTAARAWVARGRTLGARLGASVQRVDTHVTSNGTRFYSVKMRGGGTVFLSSDSELAPVVAFTGGAGDYATIDPKSPLWALLNRDISARGAQQKAVSRARSSATTPANVMQRAMASSAPSSDSPDAKLWQALLAEGAALAPKGPSGDEVSPNADDAQPAIRAGDPGDVRVAPLVQSQWSQSNSRGQACWNYYTPNGPVPSAFTEGSTTNAVCGCVATAMSQVMRYHCWPTTEVAQVTRRCSWAYSSDPGSETDLSLTTQGGIYDWESMTLRPDVEGADDVNRQAIGKLTSDAGISVYMAYTDNESGAFSFDVARALMDVWKYGNAVFFDARYVDDEIGTEERDQALQKALFANFDAGYPVVMGIPGHEIVSDGYGYNSGYDFVHLNMGWAGQCDWWYNLPNLTDAGFFGGMEDVTYNLFPEGTNTTAIVSGRALGEQLDDGTFLPMPNATVRLYHAGQSEGDPVAETVSQESGVWGVTVPAGKYDIRATSEDGKRYAEILDLKVDRPKPQDINYNSLGRPAPTVRAVSELGNSWGNDFQLVLPSVRVDGEEFYDLDHALARAAELTDPTVEILLETELRHPFAVTNSCTITATNENPWASLVLPKNGASLTVAAGARVLFTNVAFDPLTATPVNVQSNGTVAIAGAVGLPRLATMRFSGFEVAGVTTNVFEIDCAEARKDGEIFGWASIPLATLSGFANYFLCATDDELGGAASPVAVEGMSPVLYWQRDVPVPDQAAAVKLSTNDTDVVNFRTFAALSRKWIGNDATIEVVKDCPLAATNEIAAQVTIFSQDARRTVTPAGESGFTVVAGGDLVVSNLVFSGFRGKSGSLFTLADETARLTLAKGAGLRDLDGKGVYSGAVTVEKGTLTMLPGAEISKCDATGLYTGHEAYGGAVSLAGGVFDMRGGTITDCSATSGGGGVYVDRGEMRISGAARVRSNYLLPDVNTSEPNDVEVYYPDQLVVVGSLTGSIGVKGETPVEGEAFASVAEGVSAADAADAAGRLFSNEDGNFVGQLKDGTGSTIVWAETIPDLTVDPEEAVVCANGERYYASLDDALAAECAEGSTEAVDLVFMGLDPSLEGGDYDCGTLLLGDAVVRGDVTIRGTNATMVTRMRDVHLEVSAGSSLTISNVVFDACDFDDSWGYIDLYNDGAKFLYANGGSLVLQEGAGVQYVAGTARDSCGVLVENGGSLTMESGSWVSDCLHLNEDPLNGYDLGGGVIVANDGSSFEMRGGTIEYCWSVQGGGAAMSDRSEIRISGDASIVDNATGVEGGETENLVLADRASLCLADDFTGSVGITSGYQETDTNVFGYVSADYATNDVTRIQQSAEHFFRDDNPLVVGVAIAAAGGQMRLVWSDALKTDEEGRRYYEVETRDPETGVVTTERYYAIGEVPDPSIAVDPPTAVTGLIYNGNEQTGVVAAVGFTLTGNIGTNAGPYTATATLEDGYVWRDGSSDPLPVDWSIAKATYDMSGVVFTNVTYVCDGTAKSNLVDEATLPAGVTVTYVNNGQTEIDTYTVTAKFTGDSVNYEPIDDMTATLTIIDDPTPPDPPPGPTPWTVVTNQPSPIAFKSITRVSDTEWTLVVTNREPYCNYRLIWTDDLTMGFTSTGAWEKASGTVGPVWTTNVITTGGAWFWRAEGAEGTNMVPPQVSTP